MNKNILTFVLGFISGSAATVIFAKKYYEKVANDEIEQVKETYARKAEIEEAGKIDEDLKAVDKVIKEHQYNTVTDEEPKETAEDKKGPYVIQPEQFCDCDYTPMTLWYWTDGEVTNDDKKIVANVDELIGDVDEVTSYFGEYENDPDTVWASCVAGVLEKISHIVNCYHICIALNIVGHYLTMSTVLKMERKA